MLLAIRILVIALVAFLSRQASANNNYFLPGDAFFYSEPNHEWFENLDATENPTIRYQRPRKGPGGRFCGYAGYDEMQLNNFTPEMRTNLQKAYRLLRTRYPQSVKLHQMRTSKMQDGKLTPIGEKELSRTEFNLVSMLICNRDFDLKKFRPLFRYNENWADAAAAFGHPRDHVAYDFFIADSSSITDDWRDSALVKPLKFTTSVPSEKNGRLKNALINVDCQDIQILLFPTSFYEDIAYPEETVIHQLVSGNRAEPTGQTMSGGVFSIQDTILGATVDGGHNEQDSGDHDEQDPEELQPYFAYRSTSDRCDILKPVKGHWVVVEK